LIVAILGVGVRRVRKGAALLVSPVAKRNPLFKPHAVDDQARAFQSSRRAALRAPLALAHQQDTSP